MFKTWKIQDLINKYKIEQLKLKKDTLECRRFDDEQGARTAMLAVRVIGRFINDLESLSTK